MSSNSKSTGPGWRPVNVKSGIWEYFVRDSARQTAQCKLCQASLKTGGGSTRSLHTHLQTKHDINVLKGKHTSDLGSDDEGNSTRDASHPNIHKNSKSAGTSGSTMMKYILKPNDSSLAATVTRMTVRDGLPFRLFGTSTLGLECWSCLSWTHFLEQ